MIIKLNYDCYETLYLIIDLFQNWDFYIELATGKLENMYMTASKLCHLHSSHKTMRVVLVTNAIELWMANHLGIRTELLWLDLVTMAFQI